MSSICSHCKNNTLSLQYLAPVAIFFMIFLFHFAFLVMFLPLFGADAPSFPESDVAEVAFAVFALPLLLPFSLPFPFPFACGPRPLPLPFPSESLANHWSTNSSSHGWMDPDHHGKSSSRNQDGSSRFGLAAPHSRHHGKSFSRNQDGSFRFPSAAPHAFIDIRSLFEPT